MKNIPVRQIHSIQTEPDFSVGFNIRKIENVLDGKTMVQELHRHDYFYILALKKGRGNHEIDFIPNPIHDNTVFFMRPGQVHQLTLNAGSSGYLVTFDKNFYYPNDRVSEHLLHKTGTKNSCRLTSKKAKKLFDILASVSTEYVDKDEGYLEVIKANLNIFFIELTRYRHRNISESPVIISPYIQERLEEFIELLEMHSSTQKQVAEYAARLHMSVYQLNAVTKATLGKTCSEIINEHILLESKRYLLATANKISQIAYHLGYEDVSYFIRFFKKHTGFTPEAFRHNFK